MRFTGQLKCSLKKILNRRNLQTEILLFNLIFGLAFVSGLSIGLGYIFGVKSAISLFYGFVIAYAIHAHFIIKIFRGLKKTTPFNVFFILIKDLPVAFLSLIILDRITKINFIFIAAGVTVVPLTSAFFAMYYALRINKKDD